MRANAWSGVQPIQDNDHICIGNVEHGIRIDVLRIDI